MNSRATLCLVLPLFLAACAVNGTAPRTESRTRIGDAVSAPLVDLNLLRTKIPEVLVEAQQGPYQPLPEWSCDAITAQVNALNEALGPDLDVPKPDNDPSLLQRGGAEAEDAAFDALKDAAVGWIPYRGWVRKLTGAEKHSKEVRAAITAGIVRRAYLKGIGQSNGCEPPAAPTATEGAD